MTTLAGTSPTLLDVANREDKSGRTSQIVELLGQTNEMLLDAPAFQCNDGSGHKTSIRSGLPTATWRKLNYGVQPSKSTTTNVRDACGMLETYAKADKALVDMAGDPAGFRASEDKAFIEAMAQTAQAALIYGDSTVAPEKIMGLAPRFNDATNAENKDNIILADAGAAGSDQASVWLVGWGENTAHLLFPQGSKAGLQHRDLGEDTATDASGNEFQIYRTHYKWDIGLSVRDWRYVVRIANIDTSALTKDAATGSDLIDLMIQALELVPQSGSVKWAFYCNRKVRGFLRRQIRLSTNMFLSMEQVAGKRVMVFDDVPVRRCDQLLNTEAIVA